MIPQNLQKHISRIRLILPLWTPSAMHAGLVVLAILFSVLAGASGLIYPSPYSPLIVGGGIAAGAILVAWFQRPVWALYTALFVVLLPIGLIPVETHSILNRSVTVIAFTVWLFDLVIRRRSVIWTSTTLLMLSFTVWSALTLIWATDISIGMTVVQVYILRLVLYLFLVPNQIRTKENLDGLMNMLALSGWVLVLVSMGTVWFEGYTPGTRLRVLDENENALGLLALVAMPGVLWQASQPSRRHRMLKILLASIFLVLVIGLVALSGSRGSAVSLLITLLVFCFWKATQIWGKIGFSLLALGLVSASFIFSTTLERFELGSAGLVDTMLGGRETIWQAAWSLIRNDPWLGVGIGNGPDAVMPYLSRLVNVWDYQRRAIHNPVLTIWVEVGMPGLLLYLGFLGSALWSFLRQYYRHKDARIPYLTSYYALVSSVFLGYLASWIKGGGLESHFTYFLMLALLLIPSQLNIRSDPY